MATQSSSSNSQPLSGYHKFDLLLILILFLHAPFFVSKFYCVQHTGHSAHLGTARCPSSKLVQKIEKGDNLMKRVYLANWGNG